MTDPMPVDDANKSTIYHIDPKTISVRKNWNCRDFTDPHNRAHVEQLAETIREAGVKEPLTVVMEGKKAVLVNGESRLRAIQRLAEQGYIVETVPVQLDDPDLGEAEKFAEQILRNSGKPYTVLEQCEVFLRLRKLGWDDKKIAQNAGVTIERMRQIVLLKHATPAVRKMVQEGTVTPTIVQKLLQQEERDGKAAELRVNDALERAKAEGKGKISPRHVLPKEEAAETPIVQRAEPTDAPAEVHVPPVRVSAKSLLTELVTYVEKEPGPRGDTVTVTLKMPRDRWEKMTKSTY